MSLFLTQLLMKLGVSRETPSVVLNDNKSTISHVKTAKKHNNCRLSVILANLQDEIAANNFQLNGTLRTRSILQTR